MKKITLLALAIVLYSFTAFAGDAAAFVDLGFSEDSKTYIFAQYGKTDRTFNPYAEIYTIDVEKNVYVKGEVYKTSDKDTSKSGKEVYESLYAKKYLSLNKYNAKKSSADNLIYASVDEEKKPEEEIVFKDIGSDTNEEYTIKLVPGFFGDSSSFYIDLEISSDSGKKSYVVGTPDLKRKNVVGYRIIRIMRDETKKYLVFVVEKKIEDKDGVSIRYMVETVKL